MKNCDFVSFLYSKPLREYKKPTFKTGDSVQISKYGLLFSKGYKPHITRKVFEFVAITTKNHQHTQSGMSRARLFKANSIKKS